VVRLTDRTEREMDRDMEGRNVNISGNRFSVHGPPSAAANINLLLFRNSRVALYNDDNNNNINKN